MTTQSRKGNCCKIMSIHEYNNIELKHRWGSKISTPGNNNTQSLEGLAEIHTKWKICKNAGVAGKQLQLRKYIWGSKISTPGNNNTKSLEGLTEIHTKWKI